MSGSRGAWGLVFLAGFRKKQYAHLNAAQTFTKAHAIKIRKVSLCKLIPNQDYDMIFDSLENEKQFNIFKKITSILNFNFLG